MNYLSVGCGNRFHPDWVSFYLSPIDKSVITHDLSKEIPLSDKSFEVVYHSHVVKHIPRNHATEFIQECHRILKPNGILRVCSSRFRINCSNLSSPIGKLEPFSQPNGCT